MTSSQLEPRLTEGSTTWNGHPTEPFLTYADLSDTPDDGRCFELIDGRLHVSPSPTARHQYVAFALGKLLERHLPPGLIVIPDADLILDPGVDRNVLRPDLYVANRQAVRSLGQRPLAIEHCVLVVEIESPSTAKYDQRAKTDQYVGAGVPHLWRVEFTAPGWDDSAIVIACRLDNAMYREVARAAAGQTFDIDEPITVKFDPAVLTV